MRRLQSILLATAIAVTSSSAVAQELVSPKVESAAAPIYSDAAIGLERDVNVVVTIDVDGSVIDASLPTPTGDALDEIALATARRYVFSPAKRGDKPFKAKITLGLHLQGPEPAPLALPHPPPISPPISPPPIPTPFPTPEDVHVSGQKPTQSATRRTLDHREIETIPGTGGDALRTIESLPGVARAPAFSGLIILRGSSPQDSQVFVDGASVPLAFHFGGLSAIVPTELIERLDVYPGNYEVAYGRGIGGIVDMGLRGPTREGIHGVLKADIIDARALVEGALDKHTRVLVAARRSYIDAWFPSVAESLSLGVTAAPVYYDYQAIIERDLYDGATLRSTFLGANDGLALTIRPSAADDPGLTGDLKNTTVFWRETLRAEGKTKGGTRWIAQGSFGRDSIAISLGSVLSGMNNVYRGAARAQVDAPLGKFARVLGGLDVDGGSYELDLRFPAVPSGEEPDGGPLFGRKRLSQQRTFSFLNPAVFASVDVRSSKGLTTIFGVRASRLAGVPGVIVEPRATVRYLVSPDPKVMVKAAAGLYAQGPQVYENDPVFGTPGLHSARSAQVSTGIELELFHRVELSLEPFYKHLYDLVSRRPDSTTTSGFRYGNEGEGFAYGTEVLLKFKPDARFLGWIAYTISRSERRSVPEQDLRRFDYDQTHVLSALGSYRLGHGWETGVRVRYVTGNPYTPVLGGAFDADAGAYAPLEQRPLNSSRFPAFFSVDVRVEKKWSFGKTASVSVYLDVINAINHRNVEGYNTNFDNSIVVPVKGLPILPNLGLRGEL